MRLTEEEQDKLTGQIVLAWQEAYQDLLNKQTTNQWQRFAELIRKVPDPKAMHEVCRAVLEDLLPFSVLEAPPTKEDANGRLLYDFEGEETYTLWTPTAPQLTRRLTPEEVMPRKYPDEYGIVRYHPDETGKEYGLPNNASYCIPDLLIAYIHAYHTLTEFLKIPPDITLQNGAFSHLIALADQGIDPKTAARLVIREGSERRRIARLEGISVSTKADPIPPEGYEWQGVFINTNQAYQDIKAQVHEETAIEKIDQINRDNALDPTRDHLWQYICHLVNQGKPLELTLTEFITLLGLDPNNRNAAKTKLYRTLYDLWAYTLVLKSPDGYTTYTHLLNSLQFPPEDQQEKVYRVQLDDIVLKMLYLEANKRGRVKAPAAYFTIDDKHKTANAIASAFLQDESRNATRPNPTTRGAQSLMNDVYPRTKEQTHYSRYQTQIRYLFRDLQYLEEKGVFAGFNFIKGKRFLTREQAKTEFAKWVDFEGVHIEAISMDDARYQVKKERREEHQKKAEERQAKKKGE